MGQGGTTYKVYLAERPDGRRYVGCTKNAPENRVREIYHPIRHVAGSPDRWPQEEIVTTVLFTSTDPARAAAYETEMIRHYDTLEPRGANGRRASGYPVNPYTGPRGHLAVLARSARLAAAKALGSDQGPPA